MKKKAVPKPRGRPPSSEASLKTKPNISISNRLQREAKSMAARLEMGYSEFVARAIERQIAIDEAKANSDTEQQRQELKPLPSPLGERQAASY